MRAGINSSRKRWRRIGSVGESARKRAMIKVIVIMMIITIMTVVAIKSIPVMNARRQGRFGLPVNHEKRVSRGGGAL